MLATVSSALLIGVDGLPAKVEVHVAQGLPGFTIVGLPDYGCREARDRVRAAFLTSGLPWPQKRVTVNLLPHGVRKVGAGLDLAIAVGVLVADGQLDRACLARRAFLGELGLDGTVRPVPGVVPLIDAVPEAEVVVAAASAADAGLVGRHVIRATIDLQAWCWR
jgi:magnesium chelatase family protein